MKYALLFLGFVLTSPVYALNLGPGLDSVFTRSIVTPLGETILTDAFGRTLYTLDQDNDDEAEGGNLAHIAIVFDDDLKEPLGRHFVGQWDGRLTFNDHTLFTYAFDREVGDVKADEIDLGRLGVNRAHAVVAPGIQPAILKDVTITQLKADPFVACLFTEVAKLPEMNSSHTFTTIRRYIDAKKDGLARVTIKFATDATDPAKVDQVISLKTFNPSNVAAADWSHSVPLPNDGTFKAASVLSLIELRHLELNDSHTTIVDISACASAVKGAQ